MPHTIPRGASAAPLPASEPERLAALHALAVLDTPAEPEFDALVQAAAMVCGTPISLISLIDTDRQWFKANHGLPGASETPRDMAFCAHAILQDDLFVVPDAELDPRFAGNPLVTAEPRIRFYAGAPVQLSNGHVAGTLCVIDRQPRQLDASQRETLRCLGVAAARALEGRQAGRVLAQRNAFMDTTLRAIADAVLTTDLDGRLTWMNPAAEVMLGCSAGAAGGVCVDTILPLRSSHLETGLGGLLQAARCGESVALPPDAELLRAGAAPAALEGTVSPLSGRPPAGAVLVLRDVTAARLAASEMTHRATHDALTGLANRAEFDRRLRERLDVVAGGGPVDCVLFIDLDHFKIVNDSCGHTAGDRLLVQMAGILRESVRARDLVARLGGDEFAILLEQCPVPVATRLAQRICDRLESFRFAVGDKRFQVGASIGLAPMGAVLNDAHALMQAVDECCYAAKAAGRNRVVAWPSQATDANTSAGAAHWAERIGRALDEDRFVLFGQLVMPLHAHAGTVKVEVLLRMQDESGALVPPGTFMPAAERFQLMGRIDRWVLRRTLQWMRTDLARCQAQRVGVNLSGQSIGDPTFHAWAIDELRRAGPALCQALTIEITETVAIAGLEKASAFLHQVRGLGLRVALDDFGAGAATFGYLKRLPLDYLKIDGQFVRGLLVDPLDEVSVRCFVDVARVMGMKTIAEFVETAEVLDRLRTLGVDFGQGYHLHWPVPLEALCRAPAA